MEYATITVPAAPVRKKPNHKKEMINQLLFGESVKILDRKNDLWFKIKSLYDGYEGWVTRHTITPVNSKTALQQTTLYTGDFINTIYFEDRLLYIPMASTLLLQDPEFVNAHHIKYQGNLINTTIIANREDYLEKIAKQWLNAPYMWGGKTIFGVDCSGFAQTVYKLCGVPIMRDAWQQAQQGKRVKKLENAQLGDLAFFDDKEEIVHVGVLLSNKEIIHASGRVRVDAIDEKGIIAVNNGIANRTHRLKAIRRYW